MHLSLILFILLCIPFASSSFPKKIHSGRIPANIKFFFGKKHHSLKDKGIEEILADSLPPNDLKQEHKLLYYRARQKDYDFAQFAQPCRIFTLDELEAFLRIPEDAIEPQEGEHETVSPAQKGELLEKLFNHSRNICDFRNLLTCHKHFRTCACAHPSMGLNREGICGINIGHPCELSERSLLKYNILLSQETNPIKCLLENAECVLDTENLGGGISPVRKICKCRDGFWGATCRRRQGPGRIMKPATHLIPKESPDGEHDKEKTGLLGVAIPEGRTIWIHEGGGALGEYFMHPEEIKSSLVELMTERGMYPPENREEEAQKLLQRLEQDVDKEEMVVNDFHLRKLAQLSMGQQCDPERQINLDNPPVAKDGQRWIEPHPDDIKSWQLGHLQDKKPFCNIYQHLRCDDTTRVCQCKPGMKFENGSCLIPLGGNCGPDFDTFLEFDPLRDRKRFSEVHPPNCMSKLKCRDQPLFFQKKCWCDSNQNCTATFDEDSFQNMISALQSRFTLALDDSCDPVLHQQLLSYKNDNDDPSHEKRMSLLQEIIENPESRLCDIGNYMNCSDTSRTCECWKQLKPSKDGECVSINMASCGRTFEYGKYLYPEGSQLWQLEKTFQTQFLPDCVPYASCTGGDNLQWAGRCVCADDGKTGEDCSDPKSKLASAFTPSQIPSDNDDEMRMIRVFFDLNQQTYLLERLMTLSVDKVCDPGTGLKLERIVKFWKEIGSSDETISERRTLPHFIAVTKWTKYLVSTAGTTAALCDARVGLRCHRTSGQCGCPRGSRWIGDQCYLDIDEPCDHKPGADWIVTCASGSKCISLRRNYGTYQCIQCSKGGRECDGENKEDDNDYFADETGNPRIPRGSLRMGLMGRSFTPENEEVLGVVMGYQKDNSTNDEKRLPSGSGNLFSYRSSPKSAKHGKPSEGAEELLTKHQKDKFIEEINRMLKEILAHRSIPFGQGCKLEEENELSEILPTLPTLNLKKIPKSLSLTYSILSRLYWKGISVCDRKLYLTCGVNEVCGCSVKFGLIEDEGECRLMENDYCTLGSNSHNQLPMRKATPEFKCRRGTSCMRLDYGMAVCSKILDDEMKNLTPEGTSLALKNRNSTSKACSATGDYYPVYLIIFLLVTTY